MTTTWYEIMKICDKDDEVDSYDWGQQDTREIKWLYIEWNNGRGGMKFTNINLALMALGKSDILCY